MTEENLTQEKKTGSGFHVSTDIDFEIRSPRVRISLICVLVLFAVVFCGYHLLHGIGNTVNTLDTVTAKEQTYVRSISSQAFVLRDESYVQGSGSGFVVPAVADGAKVSGNNVVVNIFSSENDAKNYYDLKDIDHEIAYYEGIRNTLEASSLSDIGAYDSKVKKSLYNLLSVIDKRSYEQLGAMSDEVRLAVTKRSLAVGAEVDVTEILRSLYAQKNQLENHNASYYAAHADRAGYYVQHADGFEVGSGVYADFEFAGGKKLAERIKTISCEDVDSLLHLEPVRVSAPYGKLITSFVWYLVCNVKTTDIADLRIGQTLQIAFPNAQAGTLRAKVVSVNADGDEHSALVLSATAMDSAYANLRKTDIAISLESYTGFRVDKTALRVIDGETGVYVLLGNVVDFRKVNVLYETENYCIVANEGKNGYLRAFDEIILGGTELYDGKIID